MGTQFPFGVSTATTTTTTNKSWHIWHIFTYIQKIFLPSSAEKLSHTTS